jgi:hypothetical protein
MLRRVVWTLLVACGLAGAQSIRDLSVPTPLPEGSTLILGFMGGLDRWNDPERGVRKVALDIRAMGLPNVYAETLAHYRHREAKRLVLAALDANKNRKLDPDERGRVKVILYGQSLGGGEVVRLANDLRKAGVTVDLTVQVDSVSMRRDGHIPPNVKRAVNFYQKEILTVRGEDYIQAVDPRQTKILGNFRFRYPVWSLYPLPEMSLRRVFGGGHARMEADPLLWAQIKGLILAPPELTSAILESMR